MNRVTSIIIGVVLAVVLVGGSFWEGMNVGKAQASDAQSSFLADRGFGSGAGTGGAGGTGGTGTAGGNGGSGFGGGRRGQNGANGTISKVDGNTITLTTQQGDTVTVNITADTPVLKSAAGSSADLKPGAHITVVGDRSGTNVAAKGIQITDRPAGFEGVFGRATPTPSK